MPAIIAGMNTSKDPSNLFRHRNRKWTADWIWPSGHDAGANQIAMFRRVIDLPTAGTFRLLITACSQYRLWVDGQLIDDGPAPSAAHLMLYDEHELSLDAGRHVVAALVRVGPIGRNLRGALLAELIDDAGQVIDATGSDWRAMPGVAWRADTFKAGMNKLAAFQEHCDGRRLPVDWQSASFDDSTWTGVEVLQTRSTTRAPMVAPWTHLVPRPIPPLERQTFLPNRIVARESALSIVNRMASDDASLEVSQAGVPLTDDDAVRIDNAEALISGEDGCMLVGEPPSRDPAWDGERDPCLTVGFEREMTAFIEIELTAPAGVDVYIGSTERLFDGKFNNTLEGRFTEKYTTREGRQVFRSLHWRAFRYLRLRFRFAHSPVKLHGLRVIRVRTPMGPATDIAGNDRLHEIDMACRRTIRLCGVDGLFDTPWREAAQWLGDVAMATLPGLHWVYGETAMAGKFICQAAFNNIPQGLLCNLSNNEPQQGLPIPDYSIWWVYGLREHRWYTGNDDWYHDAYPTLRRIIDWFCQYLNDDGLLENVPGWVFIDWADCHKTGMSSSLNAIFAVALDVLAEAAEVIGDRRTVEDAKAKASAIREQFMPTFFDAERGVIMDAVEDGRFVDKISEHGIASAVFAGCVPDDAIEAMVDAAWQEQRWADQWVECQPFYTRVVLEGLWKVGRTDLAMKIIEQRWGVRFVDRGHDTCLEEWTCNGSWRFGPWLNIQRTTSHAWSACVSEFLRRRVAGIELLEPGGGKVRVTPYEADHAYTITTPLVGGTVTVDYQPGKSPEVTATGGVEVVA
jgi:alpha-L-rhamnosidase